MGKGAFMDRVVTVFVDVSCIRGENIVAGMKDADIFLVL